MTRLDVYNTVRYTEAGGHEMMYDYEDCPRCRPLGCDCSDSDRPEAVPADLLPSWADRCHCGAKYDGRDCLCGDFD